jgi:hypothetical protein
MFALAAASLAIVVACGRPGATEPITVLLDFGAARTPVASGALAEATAVWGRYQVFLQRASARSDPRSVVRITIADRAPATAPDPRAVGSIDFRDGIPLPEITLYAERAWELICAVAGSTAERWPRSYRELVLGRVLGRALAHELGHFILQSRQHSADGLMRASQSIADLIAAERTRVLLTPEDLKALTARRDGLSAPSSCR